MTKTKIFLTKFFKTFSKKPSRQAVERMYLYQSGSFVLVVCSGITVLQCSVVVHQTAEWMYLHRSGSFVSVVCSGITAFQCSVVVHSAVLLYTC